MPLEHFFVASHHEGCPPTIWLRCQFHGIFDRAIFQRALEFALHRHPLFLALVRGPINEKTSDLNWVEAGGMLPYLDWDNKGVPLRFPHGTSIDLSKEIGIRVFIREEGDKTEIVFQFHHACSDGIGTTRFLEDLLTAYACFHPDTIGIPKFRSVDPELLKLRNMFRVKWGSRFLILLKVLKECFAFFNAPFNTIASTTLNTPTIFQFEQPPPRLSHFFSPKETDKIKEMANREKVTINDLLLRDLFLALNSWNQRCSASSGPLRIGVPVNLRFLLDDHTPAMNAASLVFLNRGPKIINSPPLLLKSIHGEMKRIKQRHLGLSLIGILGQLGRIKGGIVKIARGDRVYASTILTHVGELFHDTLLPRKEGKIVSGNVRLEKIEGLPPLRPRTLAFFEAATYAGELNINLPFNPQIISSDQAEVLFSIFIERIRKSLAEAEFP